MHEVDVLFVVDALPETGFGHAARCLSLARLMRKIDAETRIGFQGTFSSSARGLLTQYFQPCDFHAPGEDVRAAVSVIDRMHDIQDADSWDAELLDKIRQKSGAVVHLTSGTKDPHLPKGVTCIGFQPGGPAARPPALLWGLEFAPVSLALGNQDAEEVDRKDWLLVALGGAHDASGIKLVVNALNTIPEIKNVDVLGSPVNEPELLEASREFNGIVKIHNSVPDVIPLLRRARVVLASFGHLVYEALACGTAACVIGQKRFQADYAELLEANGLAVSAGFAPETDAATVAEALERTWSDASLLARRGRSAIDGHGLDRIAALVLGMTDKAI